MKNDGRFVKAADFTKNFSEEQRLFESKMRALCFSLFFPYRLTRIEKSLVFANKQASNQQFVPILWITGYKKVYRKV